MLIFGFKIDKLIVSTIISTYQGIGAVQRISARNNRALVNSSSIVSSA